MKLKTKFQDEDFDFGEVVDAAVFYGGTNGLKVEARAAKGGYHTFYFDSLKELTGLFEDAPEEPKEYWYIDWIPEIGVYRTRDAGTDADERQKTIGNCFETKEEAEEAVEKLKAWKRLKDKGFRFEGSYKPNYGEKFIIECILPKETLVIDVAEDLDLLFGGEE